PCASPAKFNTRRLHAETSQTAARSNESDNENVREAAESLLFLQQHTTQNPLPEDLPLSDEILTSDDKVDVGGNSRDGAGGRWAVSGAG
ncbi:hypothetical protein B0H10DRAFT_2199245, partial [Mycena sp. CBHHK59/15]